MKIEKTEIAGFKPAIRGMRNPLNSWDKSDSSCSFGNFILGENDRKLATNLIKAGPEHSKFLRFIVCWVDLELPLYLWKEFDTYKFVEKNSCSTMHKITSKILTLNDFQIDLPDEKDAAYIEDINSIIFEYNALPKEAVSNKEFLFRKIIQKLPSSFLQKRTVITNYAELRNMYHQRKNHKLQEWKNICKWIESLPYSELIIS